MLEDLTPWKPQISSWRYSWELLAVGVGLMVVPRFVEL